MDSIYPKCFCITKIQGDKTGTLQNDIDEFNEEYRFIFSTSILKKYVKNAGDDFSKWEHKIPSILVSLNICEKRLLSIDE